MPSVNNISNPIIPPQNRASLNNNRKDALIFATGSAGVGFVGVGGYTYLKNPLVTREGFYTDKFINSMAEQFAKEDMEEVKNIEKVFKDFNSMFSEENPKASYKSMYKFLMENSEYVGIYPKEGETLKKAVGRYIKEQPVKYFNGMLEAGVLSDKDVLNEVTKEISRNGKTIRIPDKQVLLLSIIHNDLDASKTELEANIASHKNEDYIASYIDNVYDRKAKKFRAISEESPKEMHEYVKKVSDKLASTGAKLKNSAKYGGIAALAIAGGALLSACFWGRKS